MPLGWSGVATRDIGAVGKMSIQAQQLLERAPRVSLGATVSLLLIVGTLATLLGLAATGVGLVEW